MSFEATFPAIPLGVGEIRRQLTTFARGCGLAEPEVADVALAVSEAATNAVVHGYRGDEGVIHVTAETADGELTIVLTDEGRGMTPRVESSGLGLGLPIIARLARRFEVVCEGAGTRVHMVFSCPGAEAT